MSGRTLPFSLDDLNIDKNVMNNPIFVDNVDVLNYIILNGIVSYILGNPVKSSDIFKNGSDYKKFFAKLSEFCNINIIYAGETFDINNVNFDSDYILLPEGCTVLKFYESLRNSVAHRNIFILNKRYVVFQSHDGREKKSLSTAWSNKTSILLCLTDINILGKIGKFVLDYIENNSVNKNESKITKGN